VNTRKRNKTAARHGWQGEREALAWLETLTSPENIQVINTLLDFTCLDTFVEVKTCAQHIKTEYLGETRAGRFTFNADQHMHLTTHDGYYLFVVLREASPSLIFLVRARNLVYHRQLAWTTALKYREKTDDAPSPTLHAKT
jgi:hypothetical protein